jgi:hypothetical protein
VPYAYYHSHPFRIGFYVRLGGLYNPLGYYELYDTAYSNGALRGSVESVDYRHGTFVLRNDATGDFVTAVMRDRRFDDIRPGDYVEISGSWTRSGVFEARRLDYFDAGSYRR